MPENEKILTANFLFLFIALFLGIVSLTSLYFILPIYLVHIGEREVSAGISVGVFTVCTIILRPLMGKYIDRYGCKKVLLMGIGIYALSSFFYTISATSLSIYIIRAVQGAGWGAFFISSYTLASRLAPALRQGETLGYFTSAPPIGMAVGPIIGESIYLQWGYFESFLMSGTIATIALIFCALVKEPSFRSNHQLAGPLISRFALFPSTIVLLIHVTLGAVITYLPLLSQDRGIARAGVFFTVYGVIIIITRPLGSKAIDRYGYKLLLIPSLASLGLSMIMVAFLANMYYLIFAAVLFGLGFSLSLPALMALCIALCPEEERARAMATFTASIDVGIGFGSLGIGIILAISGFTTIYLVCAGVVFIGLILVKIEKLSSSQPVPANKHV